MSLIRKFDPWASKLCTCPSKLTLNPYSGCDHACVYCYASSYIPRFAQCRPKKNLIPRLRREASKLNGETISISNSSDPYPNLEAETGLTRKCLEVLSEHNCKLQMITKSDLVTRDIDLLKKVPSMVSMTITTEDDATAKLIEPSAPPTSARLKALETLIGEGIPVTCRIDPVIPFLNDNPENLVRTLSSLGVKHVTCSTYKVKPDNWKRFARALPRLSEKLKQFYLEKGERIGGYIYLPSQMRLEAMKRVAELAKENGMRFGTCREDLSSLNMAACDGSWLLREKVQVHQWHQE